VNVVNSFFPSSFEASVKQGLIHEHETLPIEDGVLNAAVALVFRVQNDSIELLFMQRAQHPKDPWSGHIAFPGGACEKEDQHTQATAIRETHEELGVILSDENWLGSINHVYGPVIDQDKRVRLAPHIFLLDEQQELILNEEAQDAFWVPLSRLVLQQNIKTFNHNELSQYQMYGIDLGISPNILLWGLSLKVLYDFFDHIKLIPEQRLVTFEK
jgi:8-oxo-dGTP pyrophosphatase MutT (NUDIX family)